MRGSREATTWHRGAVLILTVCSLAGCAAKREARVASPPLRFDDRAVTRDVVLVGNNWAGTAIAFDPKTHEILTTINIVPDREKRNEDIQKDHFFALAAGLNARLAGEGHDQLVDDLFTSSDGRYLFASRPTFADVVAIDLMTRDIVWRRPVAGHRADHAALSPDGERLLVSASTAGVVQEIDTTTGVVRRKFKSGDEPHENNYVANGTRIYHASIGRVFLPRTSDFSDRLKGKRQFEIVDAGSFKVLERFDMKKLTAQLPKKEEHAIDGAVRPMAVTADGRFVFLQMSFMHGFYVFNVADKKIERFVPLEVSEELKTLPRRNYQLDSAHHGITLSGDERKLCVAGTMAGYAAVVRRDENFAFKTIPVGPKPYWATTSADGKECYVSVSEEDRVAIISFDTETEVASIKTGDHPQRVRVGKMVAAAIAR